MTLRAQGNRQKAAETSKAAVAEFQEAAKNDPGWADPYLGLARIYAYDLFDLDALQKNLGEAGQRGYRIGKRETAMLADGFRMQGLGFEARAQRADEDVRAALLKQARAYFQQAVRYYDQIGDYGDSGTNRDEAQSHLEAIDGELAPPEPEGAPARGPAGPQGLWQRLGRALVRELTRPPRRRR